MYKTAKKSVVSTSSDNFAQPEVPGILDVVFLVVLNFVRFLEPKCSQFL